MQKRFPVLPFTLRAIEDEQVARVGVSEARRHELLDEYPVLKEANNVPRTADFHHVPIIFSSFFMHVHPFPMCFAYFSSVIVSKWLLVRFGQLFS